jgi:hypothetical protein
MARDMLAPYGIPVIAPPTGISQRAWNNILPGAQEMAVGGMALPAYMWGLNPNDYQGGVLTAEQAAAIFNQG